MGVLFGRIQYLIKLINLLNEKFGCESFTLIEKKNRLWVIKCKSYCGRYRCIRELSLTHEDSNLIYGIMRFPPSTCHESNFISTSFFWFLFSHNKCVLFPLCEYRLRFGPVSFASPKSIWFGWWLAHFSVLFPLLSLFLSVCAQHSPYKNKLTHW